MKKINTLLLTILTAGSLLVLTPAPAFADVCDNLDKTFDQYGGKPNLPRYCTPGSVIQQAMNIAFILIAACSIIFIMIGGFRYITSAGNTERATKAKQTALYAVAGLVVVIVAATIVNVVINTVVGA